MPEVLEQHTPDEIKYSIPEKELLQIIRLVEDIVNPTVLYTTNDPLKLAQSVIDKCRHKAAAVRVRLASLT